MHSWYYRFPGNFYAYGPTKPMYKYEVRKYLRKLWEVKRLPRGTEIWIAGVVYDK